MCESTTLKLYSLLHTYFRLRAPTASMHSQLQYQEDMSVMGQSRRLVKNLTLNLIAMFKTGVEEKNIATRIYIKNKSS